MKISSSPYNTTLDCTHEDIYKGLFEHSRDAIAVYDPYKDGEDFIFVDVNPKLEEIEKLQKKDLIGKKVSEVFPLVKELSIFEAFKTTYKTGVTQDVPVVLYEDNRISGYRKNTVIKLPSTHILVIYNDETELEYTKRMLDTTVNTVNSMIFTTIDGLGLDWCNEFTLKSLKYSSIEEFKKKHVCVCEYFEEDLEKGYISDKPNGMNWLYYTLENQSTSPIKVKITIDGDEKIFSVSVGKVDFDNKERYVVVLHEITDLQTSLLKQKKLTQELIQNRHKIVRNFESVMHTFVNILEEKDTYTAGHSKRVAEYSKEIARKAGCTADDIDIIFRAGQLHDIGKIITPESILLKPNRFNDDEYALMKEHSVTGYTILNQIDDYKNIAQIIRSHHEKYNGSGYPDELKADNIPLLSRIMTIADSFDAMTTNRVYKPRMKIKEAIEELKNGSGTHFDPDIIPYAVSYFSTIGFIDTSKNIPDDDISRHRFAYFFKDSLTTAYNKAYLDVFLNENFENDIYSKCCVIDLHNLHKFNKKYDWEQGDEVLKKISTDLINMPSAFMVFRILGDKFVVIFKDKIENFDIQILELPDELYITKKKLDLLEQRISSSKELISFI